MARILDLEPGMSVHAPYGSGGFLVKTFPMWNQGIPTGVYEHALCYRFLYGVAPASSAAWG